MILAAWAWLDGRAASLPALAPPIPLAALPAFLSPAETARANAFKRPGRKSQYLAGHGLLRLLAGSIAGISADRIELPAEGPPRWEDAPVPMWLSLSHSGTVVIAVASDAGPVGVDIERMDQERDWAGLAAGMGWDTPPAWDKRGFLEHWTLREAEFKAGLAPGSGAVRRADTAEFCLAIASFAEERLECLGPNP